MTSRRLRLFASLNERVNPKAEADCLISSTEVQRKATTCYGKDKNERAEGIDKSHPNLVS